MAAGYPGGILSQGWELYQGTAGRMESGVAKKNEEEPVEEAKSA